MPPARPEPAARCGRDRPCAGRRRSPSAARASPRALRRAIGRGVHGRGHVTQVTRCLSRIGVRTSPHAERPILCFKAEHAYRDIAATTVRGRIDGRPPRDSSRHAEGDNGRHHPPRSSDLARRRRRNGPGARARRHPAAGARRHHRHRPRPGRGVLHPGDGHDHLRSRRRLGLPQVLGRGRPPLAAASLRTPGRVRPDGLQGAARGRPGRAGEQDRAATASRCSGSAGARPWARARSHPVRHPQRPHHGAGARRREGRHAAAAQVNPTLFGRRDEPGPPSRSSRRRGWTTCWSPPRRWARRSQFYTDVLGFRITEQLLDGNGHQLGTWMERSHSPHDLAVVHGPNGGLHHFAYWLDDWDDVRDAADVLAYNGIQLDVGPTRHGITRGSTIYFFDPLGTRNEVFTGGYRPDPDFPTHHLDRGQHRPGDLLLRGRAQRPLHEGAHMMRFCAFPTSSSGCRTSSWRPPTTPRSSA